MGEGIVKTASFSSEEQLYGAVGYCLFMILLFLIVQKFPPKKINWLYGYRTRRSMANDAIWQTANRHSITTLLRFSSFSLLFPFVFYFFFPQYNFLATVVSHTVFMISSILVTEYFLDRHFDSNGNRK